jgi:DNA-directed RNA polymerase subunit H (RpoH/RPB5)
MITKEKLSIYIEKTIVRYTDLKIDNYLHEHFIIELNKGPLCSVHSVLSIEEGRAVCMELMIHGHKLPAIFINDPQNIWIGGKINDIIKIDAYSEITGKTVRYRIVTPVLGKPANETDSKKMGGEFDSNTRHSSPAYTQGIGQKDNGQKNNELDNESNE